MRVVGSGVVGSSGEYVKGAQEQGSSSSSFPLLYYSSKLRDPSIFSKISNSPSPFIGDDAVWRRAILLFPSHSSLSGCTLICPRPPLLFLSSLMKLNATSGLAR